MTVEPEDRTILDDLTIIEKIENETPWNTADLAGFLIPLIRERNIDKIAIKTLQARPGVRREDQKLASANLWDRRSSAGGENHLVVRILSPKRAAARTDLLDRLSFSGDLKASEAVMPQKVLARLKHSIENVDNRAGWNTPGYHCRYDDCGCDLPDPDYIVRGCTKTRTKPVKSLEDLESELHWANRGVEQKQERLKDEIESSAQYIKKLQTKLDKEIEKRDRLVKRIDRMKAKG